MNPSDQAALDAAEDQEWAAAIEETYPTLDVTKEEPTDESAEPETTTETTTAPPEDTEDEAPDGAKGTGDDAEAGSAGEGADAPAKEGTDGASEEASPANPAVRDTRVALRESAQEVEAVKTDIREQLFADVPTELKDADGDPIKGVEDVMKLINPVTQQPFTEEEAGMWLLSAQQKLNQTLADTSRQVEEIAEVNIDLKDQSDSIVSEYGELLKALPEVRDQIWTEYQKTLVKDPKSGIITKAPVSLENFYRIALKPYVDLAAKLETQEAETAAQTAQAAEQAKLERQRQRADRSDIYGGRTDIDDPDEDEWAEAAKSYYGTK